MRVTFYQSPLCPRCRAAGKNLAKIASERPGIEIEKVDVITDFSRMRKDGVLLFPALKVGEEKLSGVFLSQEKIENFLTQAGSSKS